MKTWFLQLLIFLAGYGLATMIFLIARIIAKKEGDDERHRLG